MEMTQMLYGDYSIQYDIDYKNYQSPREWDELHNHIVSLIQNGYPSFNNIVSEGREEIGGGRVIARNTLLEVVHSYYYNVASVSLQISYKVYNCGREGLAKNLMIKMSKKLTKLFKGGGYEVISVRVIQE